MKSSKKELDVDFIGGVRTLTKEDEQAISDFLKKRKLSSKKSIPNKTLRKNKQTKAPF